LTDGMLYDCSTSAGAAHVRFRELRLKWTQLSTFAGLDIAEQRFHSGHGAASKHVEVSDNVDCMNAIGTALFWVALSSSVGTRRPKSLQDEIELRLNLFAEGVVDSDIAKGMVQNVKTWSSAEAGRCNHVANHAGQCAHIQSLFQGMGRHEGLPPQHQLVKMSIAMVAFAPLCEATRLKWRVFVESLTYAIDEGCETWGQWDLTKVEWLNDNPRKRKDPHLARFLAEAAQKAKRGKTVQNACAGAGLDWSRQQAKRIQRKALCGHMAGCFEAFEVPSSVACITDGVRIGKPAKEFTATAVEDLATAVVGVLPPADHSGLRS
jgi:hypothetical protein